MEDDTITTTTNPPLRRLGPIELYCSSRHHLGLYLAVVVTCRYHGPRPLDQNALLPALSRVVQAQPMLRVGILDDDTNDARFCPVKLSLAEHVSFSVIPCSSVAEFDSELALRQAWHHDQRWTDLSTRPPWRIEVASPSSTSLRGTQDIIFAFHHALLDGSAGRLFHESLVRHLNSAATDDDSITQLPPVSSLPDSQHHAVPFSNTPWFLLKTLWTELGPSFLQPSTPPSPWHGHPIDFSLPYTTRVKTIDIPSDLVSSLVASCRRHQTSLTGLIHALVLASCASRLDTSFTFTSTTPISLRPYLPPSQDASLLRNLITAITHTFPVSLLPPLHQRRGLFTPTIWLAAARVKKELAARTASLPTNDPVSLMRFIPDFCAWLRAKDGKPRPASWEVSNIGVAGTTDGGEYAVERMCFTNGGMVVGAPLSVGVAGVRGGAVTLGVSWQEGVVTSEFVGALEEDLRGFVECFGRTGVFIEGEGEES